MKLSEIPKNKLPSMLKSAILWPLNSRYRARFAQRHLPESTRIVFDHTVMTRCKKLLFVKNAKAGSTSVAKLIIHYSTGKLVDKPHQRQDGVFSGFASSVEFGAAFKSPDTYCFTMVREPAARLQSAFLNLFVDQQNLSAARHLSPLIARGFDPNQAITRNFEIFLDYVEESLADSPKYCDQHWRPQYINLGRDGLTYDQIGKLETYNQSVSTAFEDAGLGAYLKTVNWRQKSNVSSSGDSDLTKSHRPRIERVYARDYELFGY